uniref:Uncharacterized protein n=1 Tax=Anguilla anguilla TaxID=7936 RepID=A0A0E9X6G2_ANGAN
MLSVSGQLSHSISLLPNCDCHIKQGPSQLWTNVHSKHSIIPSNNSIVLGNWVIKLQWCVCIKVFLSSIHDSCFKLMFTIVLVLNVCGLWHATTRLSGPM